ncbi:MAG: hypothetical protein HONBIEJF_02801 [Fimbriimonadaceae bacterium]|nr:hypothetical protein [Fimbriimonadaceae bacterium]
MIVTIRPYRPDSSIDTLTEMIRQAYGDLADRGLRFWATHQSSQDTIERIDRGICWVAWSEDHPVGTLTYYPAASTSGCDWYDRADVSAFGQFAVAHEHRGTGLGDRLIQLAINQANADGAGELALDTAEPAEWLINYYAQRGFRFIQFVRWEAVNYRSVVMSRSLKPDGSD